MARGSVHYANLEDLLRVAPKLRQKYAPSPEDFRDRLIAISELTDLVEMEEAFEQLTKEYGC